MTQDWGTNGLTGTVILGVDDLLASWSKVKWISRCGMWLVAWNTTGTIFENQGSTSIVSYINEAIIMFCITN